MVICIILFLLIYAFPVSFFIFQISSYRYLLLLIRFYCILYAVLLTHEYCTTNFRNNFTFFLLLSLVNIEFNLRK